MFNKYANRFKINNFLLIKIVSFITSMFPSSIFLFFKYTNEYTKFLGYIPKNLFVNIFIIVEIFSALTIYFFFRMSDMSKKRNLSQNYNVKRYHLEDVVRDKNTTTNYLLANVLPMIALELDYNYNFIFFIFLFISLGFMYIKNDLFYNNPFYDFMGIKVYTSKVFEIVENDKYIKRNISIVLSKSSVYDFDNNECRGVVFKDVLIILKSL